MGRIIVVTSGKGGVGKTTSTASLGVAFAMRGYKVAVIDFDIGLRNLDLVMGCAQRVVYDLLDVAEKKATLTQALINFKRVEGLYLLASPQIREKSDLSLEALEEVLAQLVQRFDYVICDSPAGIEHGAIAAMYFADEAVVVVNPEVASVRDSDRMTGLIAAKSRRAEIGWPHMTEWLLITRYDPDRAAQRSMLSFEDIADLMSVPLLGVIPESDEVLNLSNIGMPVALDKNSSAGKAYHDAAARLLGQDIPFRFVEPRGLIGKLLNQDFR